MDFFTISIIVLFLLIGIAIGHIIGTIRRNKYWEAQIEKERKDAIAKSRAVLGGLFSEQLAPYLPDFPYNPSEVRFIGKPIDFIVFKGADEKNINEVVFDRGRCMYHGLLAFLADGAREAGLKF